MHSSLHTKLNAVIKERRGSNSSFVRKPLKLVSSKSELGRNTGADKAENNINPFSGAPESKATNNTIPEFPHFLTDYKFPEELEIRRGGDGKRDMRDCNMAT